MPSANFGSRTCSGQGPACGNIGHAAFAACRSDTHLSHKTLMPSAPWLSKTRFWNRHHSCFVCFVAKKDAAEYPAWAGSSLANSSCVICLGAWPGEMILGQCCGVVAVAAPLVTP